MRMFGVLLAMVAGLVSAMPGQAGAAGRIHRAIDWQQRDTAIYVVSTLNLVHVRHNQPLVSVVQSRLDVTRYAVYSAAREPNLFFIRMQLDDGSCAGALAYRMGWRMPRSISTSVRRLGVSTAPVPDVRAYWSGPKKLIGTFTSTLPSY